MTTVEPIETRVAHTGVDELRFHGRRVFGELLGNSSVGQMIMLGATGRRLEADEIGIVDDIVTAMSSADPRLWPFKITRLASAYGTASFGIAATLVAAEGGMFGPNRLESAAVWLVDLERRGGADDLTDDDIAAALDAGGAEGFGVLYRTHDERFAALMRQVEKRQRHEHKYTRLCLQAVRVARARKQLEAHVFLGIAALGLDLGLSPRAVSTLATVLLFHDSLANAAEGATQQPSSLRALPRDTVEYRGSPHRRSPRAASGL